MKIIRMSQVKTAEQFNNEALTYPHIVISDKDFDETVDINIFHSKHDFTEIEDIEIFDSDEECWRSELSMLDNNSVDMVISSLNKIKSCT